MEPEGPHQESTYNKEIIYRPTIYQIICHLSVYPIYQMVDYSCTTVLLQAELQRAAAFLPGRIAEAHVSAVASNLIKAVGGVSGRAGLVSKPVQHLTEMLGDPRLRRSVQEYGRRLFDYCIGFSVMIFRLLNHCRIYRATRIQVKIPDYILN